MLAALLREPRRLRSAGGAAWAALRRACASDAHSAASPPELQPDAGARRRQKTPGTRGAKTAEGRPAPDPRTVAYLVDCGLFSSAAAAEAALCNDGQRRYPFETARPAIDWLRATFPAQRSATSANGLAGAARIIARRPMVLATVLEPMQQRWEAMLTPRDAGGLGLDRATALKRLESYPHLFSKSTEALRAKVALIESLGAEDAVASLSKAPSLAGLSPDTLAQNAAWLAAQRLDLRRTFSQAPALLYLSRGTLEPKLEFLRRVAHLSDEDLNFDPTILGRSLEGRLRPRFMFALYFGAHELMRFTSLVIKPDVDALEFIRRRATMRQDEAAAADWSRGWYDALLASDAFRAWAAQTEAQRRAQWERRQQSPN